MQISNAKTKKKHPTDFHAWEGWLGDASEIVQVAANQTRLKK